jgi:DNA end-binding protein Ku
MGDGIRGITLRYSHEIRDASNYFSDVPKLKLPDEMLRIAEHIVETKTSEFDPAFLEDRYRTVFDRETQKEAGRRARKVVVAKPSAENVINLMDVLKRSLEAELPARRAAATRATAHRRAAASKSKRANARARKVS